MASATEVKRLLAETSIPVSHVEELLGCASTLWLLSAPAPVLAGDLALCHPPLAPREVRAVAHPVDGGMSRLTVVAHDRRGLLADTAAVLAAAGVSIVAASAVTWTETGVALHALTVDDAHLAPDGWDQLGECLRQMASGKRPAVEFVPGGPAVVSWTPPTAGRCVISVAAPDQIGLLWSICQWLADHELSIEAAHVGDDDGRASDHFVVVGDADLSGLEPYLSGGASSQVDVVGTSNPLLGVVTGAAFRVANVVTGVIRGVLRRSS